MSRRSGVGPAEKCAPRLLHVCGRLRPGGITTFVQANLALNEVFPVQHDLLITLAGGPEPHGSQGRVQRLDYSHRSLLRCLHRARSLIRSYDAVAVHGAHPVVVLALLLSGKRCFVFQHGMAVSSGSRLRRRAKKLWHSLVPRVLKANVICSSPYAARKAHELGIRLPQSKLLIIPFGTAMPRKRRADRRRKPNELVVGLAGRLEPQKRQWLVLESLRSYRGAQRVRVLIAGDGHEYDRLREIGGTLSREHVEVEFLGVVDDMASFYDQLDLLIFPSAGESLGLVVLEALTRSVPVAVFRDVGGCLPLVADGRTGFVVKDGVEGLRALWRSLDAEPALLDRLATGLSHMDLSALSAARTRAALDGLMTGTAERFDRTAWTEWAHIGVSEPMSSPGMS